MKRTLLIARHAHARFGAEGDRLRSLSSRGQEAARQLGESLLSGYPSIDHVVTSDAVRAVQTAQIVHRVCHLVGPLERSAAMYEGGISDYLLELLGVSSETRAVLLVGHNPTVSALFERLSGRWESFAPATCAAITWKEACSWESIAWNRAGRGEVVFASWEAP